VGQEGQVHLFEPQPELCRRVQAAIDRSAITNIRLHSIALMDRDGEMVLSMPPYHSGMATLVSSTDQDQWLKQTIGARDIAVYLPPLINGRPFGVKIDVEGAEVYLMPWLLRQPNLRFLIFEAAHNQRELWDMIEASGLTLYGLRRRVFVKQVQRVERYEQMSRYHDLVAVRLRATERTPQVTSPRRLSQKLD
jgi:FkbM family methyltransferase